MSVTWLPGANSPPSSTCLRGRFAGEAQGRSFASRCRARAASRTVARANLRRRARYGRRSGSVCRLGAVSTETTYTVALPIFLRVQRSSSRAFPPSDPVITAQGPAAGRRACDGAHLYTRASAASRREGAFTLAILEASAVPSDYPRDSRHVLVPSEVRSSQASR